MESRDLCFVVGSTNSFADSQIQSPQVLVRYTYDAIGSTLSTATTIDGILVGENGYVYDSRNQMTQITQVGAELVEKHVDLAYNELGLLKEVRRFADITGLQAAGMLDRLSQIRAELDDAAVLASLDFLPDSARAVSLQPALSLQSSTEVMFQFQRANLRTSMSASESLELWLGVNPWMSRSCIGS